MENSIGLVQTQYLKLNKTLTLECTKSLKDIQIAYETYGTLNENKDNVILICHALTADAHAAGYHSENDRKPGWWDSMIGPNKAFDTNKFFCQKKTETETCISVGDILYNSGTCSSADDVDANLTPIGVVFDIENRLALALTDVKLDGSAGSETMRWSWSDCDTPNLENCTNSSMVTTTCGTDGRTNTDAILAGPCYSSPTYSVRAVNTYKPNNCSKVFCRAGNWFLPSIIELDTIYNNKSVINNTLASLSSKGASQLVKNVYWSSDEYSGYSAWGVYMYNGTKDYFRKTLSYYVRPVVQY